MNQSQLRIQLVQTDTNNNYCRYLDRLCFISHSVITLLILEFPGSTTAYSNNLIKLNHWLYLSNLSVFDYSPYDIYVKFRI